MPEQIDDGVSGDLAALDSGKIPELVYKGYNPSDDEMTVEGGDIIAVVSTDDVDDEGEVVIPKNINLERFRKVRQIYFDHDLARHPIGAAKWIKAIDSGRKLISKHYFSKSTELGRAVGDLVREGVYRCYSVGCLKSSRKLSDPTSDELRQRPEWNGSKVWRGNPLMVEFSVPRQAANPNCVALAVSKSWGKETVDLLTGKTAATVEKATEIVAEIEQAKQQSPNRYLTERDCKGIIATRLEQATKALNSDEVVAKVLLSLSTR